MKQNPYQALLHDCFTQAKQMRASDIHFEPYPDRYLIRFRRNGQLFDWMELEASHSLAVTASLKALINMDLGIATMPQDSSAAFRDLKMEVRGNSMPVTAGGEKIVLRLQHQETALTLNQMGIAESYQQLLLAAIKKPDGIILISGPTGSGKTTTLYSLLDEIDRIGRNITTLENPVERQLPRINQALVNDHHDFPSFQRALMRQDPDVLLLGEIRDAETAELAFKLAATGHLVLSTIHANSALQVVERLKQLGVDQLSIESSLRLSVAQRLLGKLCSSCALAAGDGFKQRNSAGCADCHNGLVGRVAVIEALTADGVMSRSLGEEALALASQGTVALEEAKLYQLEET